MEFWIMLNVMSTLGVMMNKIDAKKWGAGWLSNSMIWAFITQNMTISLETEKLREKLRFV